MSAAKRYQGFAVAALVLSGCPSAPPDTAPPPTASVALPRPVASVTAAPIPAPPGGSRLVGNPTAASAGGACRLGNGRQVGTSTATSDGPYVRVAATLDGFMVAWDRGAG